MSLIIQALLCGAFVITVYARPDAIDQHIYRDDAPAPHSLNPISLIDRLINNVVGRILDGNAPPNLLGGSGNHEASDPNLISSLLNILGMFARNPRTEPSGPVSDNHYDYNENDYEEEDYPYDDTSAFRAGKDPFTNDVKDNAPNPEKEENSESDGENNTNARQPRTSSVEPPAAGGNESPARSSVAKPQGQGFLPTYTNSPNQGSFFIPISSLPQNPNFITNGVNLPGVIFNPSNPSAPINNGNAPGNLFFPISGSPPNVFYVVNPNNVNPGTNSGNPLYIPINFINNQGQKNPGSSNGFYYVPPKGGSGATPVNFVPAPEGGMNFVPGNGGSPINFVPGNGNPNPGSATFIPGSGSNPGSPINFVPGNGSPIRFVPANGLPDTNGSPVFVAGGGSGEGSAIGFVPINGNPSYSVISSGGNYLVTNKGAANTTEDAPKSNGDTSQTMYDKK